VAPIHGALRSSVLTLRDESGVLLAMRKLALTLALVAAAGCSHKKPRPPPPAPIPVDLPQIAFEGAHLDEFKFTQTLLTFRARVDNPNPFPLSVSRVRFAILLEGRPAAQGQVETAFAIPAAVEPAIAEPAAVVPAALVPGALPGLVPGRGSISFPVAIRFGAVPGFAKVMATQKEAAYALTGAVAFRTPHGVVEVPIQGGGMIGIPRMPEVQAPRIRLRSASPMEVVLEARLRIANPNGFPLPAARLHYALLVSKKEIAQASGGLESIGPGESGELVVPIKISVLKAGKAAARFLIPFASIKVALKGGLDFDGVPIPLDLDADVLPKE
jgi:LEA14-like dessication related protein